MAELSNFEKFQRGIPLTDELRDIRDSNAAVVEMPQPTPAKGKIDKADRQLKREERADLKELLTLDGYPTLQRIFEKLVQLHEKSAISLSKQDPLGNQAEVVNAWAYVTIAKQVQREFFAAIEHEVAELDKETEARKLARKKRTIRKDLEQ